MRRRALTVAVLGVVLLAAPAHAYAEGISLSPAGDSKFPRRTFVVTLPENARLTPEQVQVTENGAAVHDLSTQPAGAAKRAKLGVVLAIDASKSMQGEAFAGALEAAHAFARERDPRQPLALVTFGSEPRVLLPFTPIAGEIDRKLESPGTPEGGTRMYDAALQSIQLIRRAGLEGGFVVVLSDGSDHGSTATSESIVAAAQAAHVRLYTVGLESPVFDPAALSDLAEGGGGSYSQATSAGELQEIYRALGAQLSNAHVLTYHSLAAPGARVRVRAVVAGQGTATSTYTSPKLHVSAPAGDTSGGGGLDSPVVTAIVIFLVAALLALAISLVRRSRRPRKPRERVSEFVGPADEEGVITLTGRIAAGAERSISNAGLWQGLGTALDIGGIQYTAGQVVLASAIAAMSLALLLGTVAGPVALIPLVIVPVGVWVFIRTRMSRERRKFGDQLADHLSVVGGSLRVGHGLAGALAAALNESPEPSRREFARAVTDERLGMPLEDALERVAERMQNREVEHISLLAKLQREAGADAAEMVDQVVATVRERQELRRMVRTLTAQGRFSQVILTLLPITSLLLLTIIYNDYVQPLYDTAAGHIVLALSALLLLSGALVIRRILAFKV